MKRLKTEGLEFIYLSAQDRLTFDEQTAEAHLLRATWDQIEATGLHDIRPILINYPVSPHKQHIRFLHWNDQRDLLELDVRVDKDLYTDEDFRLAVVSEFGRTRCSNCDWEGYMLVLFTADVYAHLPLLEKQKIEQRNNSTGFEKCPACGSNFRQMVVKVFSTSMHVNRDNRP